MILKSEVEQLTLAAERLTLTKMKVLIEKLHPDTKVVFDFSDKNALCVGHSQACNQMKSVIDQFINESEQTAA